MQDKSNSTENSEYVQRMLNYFTSMNIEGLRMHLKATHSYQETSKEIFLAALEKTFKSLSLDNSELFISRGKCCSETCGNMHNRGFRFIGNKTKDYLDLIFDIKEDDIMDIYSCAEFCSESNENDLGIQCNPYINSDDRLDFYKSDLYHQKVKLALTAIHEIIFESPQPIDFEKLEKWLNEHSFTVELIGDFDLFAPQMKWTPFLQLFEELKEIYDFIKNNTLEIDRANHDFKEIKEESEYIDWILFNEKIVQAAPYVWNYEYQSIGNYYSRTETDQPIHFNGIQMLAFFDFLKNYDKKLSELLGKYNSLSLEEEMEIMQSDPDHDFAEIFNLRFHLKRRATLLEYGVELPLYLREKI
jgi:hypothetical protein